MGAKTARRLVILLVVTIVASVSIFFIQRYQVSRMDQSVLERAEQAAKAGDLENARQLYANHLEVVPTDDEARLQLADLLLEGEKDREHQTTAAVLLTEILTRSPYRAEVRRRRAKLFFEARQYENALGDVENLLKDTPDDGELCFMLARCQEERRLGNATPVVALYEKAIETLPKGDARLIEAYQRKAEILQQLNRPGEADEAIKKMVDIDPNDYRARLERGAYLARYGKGKQAAEVADGDFEFVLKQAPSDPMAYTKLSDMALEKKDFKAAHRALEAGLKVVPRSPELHLARAFVELRAGSSDAAVASLKQSLGEMPDQPNLHWWLSRLYAETGKTSELLREIEELNRLGFDPIFIQYLQAYYQVNSKQWSDARRSLDRLQPVLEKSNLLTREQKSDLQASVSKLLARCYPYLEDTGGHQQEEALVSALRDKPDDTTARRNLAMLWHRQGQLSKAIAEYRRLVNEDDAPSRTLLVGALIDQNSLLPADQRNWNQVEALLQPLEKSAPDVAETIILRAELFRAMGLDGRARQTLEQARRKSPKNEKLWIASVEMFTRQKNYREGRELLEQAQKAIGDSVDLRLARTRLLISQDPADLTKLLGQIAENSSAFSPDDRRRLLGTIATELTRRGDRDLAGKLWKELAALDPKSLQPHVRLIELALDANDKAGIDQALEQIRRIDGDDGTNARYWSTRSMIWQAEQLAGGAGKANDGGNRNQRLEALRLRNEARLKLGELATLRPSWPLVPLALGKLDELDAEQPDLDDSVKKSKQGDAGVHYRQTIELGMNSLNLLRRTTSLLLSAGRFDELRRLWSQLPDSRWQHDTAELVFREGNIDEALRLAQSAVDAKPNDFQERLWLATLLLRSDRPGRQGEAEAQFRGAAERAGSNPTPWLVLVEFLISTGQLEKAEGTMADARKALGDEAPLGLARCCEVLSRAYVPVDIAKAESWNKEASDWFKKAQGASENDPVAIRQHVDFLIGFNRLNEAAALLLPITERKHPLSKNPEDFAWANQTLAKIWSQARSPRTRAKALELAAPLEKEYEQRGPDRASMDPARLRTLASVYEAQQRPDYRKKAREIYESLLASGAATHADRFRLAVMYSRDGDWTKAQEQYRELIAQTEKSRDYEALPDRVRYLAQFFAEILERHRPEESQDLVEARELLDKLKAMTPDAPIVVGFEARLQKAEGQEDKARETLSAAANRPGASDEFSRTLALQAEAIGLPDLARTMLGQLVARSDNFTNRVLLAALLGRQGDFKGALDELEPLWKKPEQNEQTAAALLDIVEKGGTKVDKAQLKRAADRVQEALEKKPDSPSLLTILAGLRERQGDLADAEKSLRRLLALGDNPTSRLMLVRLLGRREQFKQALDELEVLWKQADRPEALTDYLQLILATAGTKLDRAQVDRMAGWVEQALKRKPDSSELLSALGVIRERQGAFAEAETLYRRDIEQGQASGLALNNLAWLTVLRNGKSDEALRLINQAIEQGGIQEAELLDTRGMVYLKSGDPRRAIEDLKKACAMSPQPPKYFHLAQAYLQANDKPAALQAMNQAGGLKPEELHPLEAPAYSHVLAALKSP
jgi:tetratricopeptide (TPR) repeat protein